MHADGFFVCVFVVYWVCYTCTFLIIPLQTGWIAACYYIIKDVWQIAMCRTADLNCLNHLFFTQAESFLLLWSSWKGSELIVIDAFDQVASHVVYVTIHRLIVTVICKTELS